MGMAVEMPEIWLVVERIRADGRLTGIYSASTVGCPGSHACGAEDSLPARFKEAGRAERERFRSR